ncbi:hypothetical protein OsJ_21851 [Oryza sativa Japonica Group]|uniref:Uncharacterized protein n=1 Tax=Oryza sativa subsp. japonica TaxID=39947 RepID=B9FTZ8_ORYSJ|nr:hypothetical protein OsJ_21851 [Oryza sativa Japonica Group]
MWGDTRRRSTSSRPPQRRRQCSPSLDHRSVDAHQLSPGMDDYRMDDRHMDGLEGDGDDPTEQPIPKANDDTVLPMPGSEAEPSAPSTERAECWRHFEKIRVMVDYNIVEKLCLHLLVQEQDISNGFTVITNLHNKIRQAVSIIEGQSVMKERFRDYCRAKDKPVRMFGIDVKHRWNTTYLMLRQLKGLFAFGVRTKIQYIFLDELPCWPGTAQVPEEAAGAVEAAWARQRGRRVKAEGCRPLPSRRRRRQRWTSWRHNSARFRSAGAATALDVVDEDDDPKVRLARVEWKLRLDGATNELEDLVGEMEEAVEAEKKARCWAPWRQRCRGAAEVVAGWLRSDPRIKVRLELDVGRLTVTGVYVQGGELLVLG